MTVDQMTASLREWAARDGLSVDGQPKELAGQVFKATLARPNGKPWDIVLSKRDGYTAARLEHRYVNATRAFANGH